MSECYVEYGKVIKRSSRFSTFTDFRRHVYKASQLNKKSETARRVVYTQKTQVLIMILSNLHSVIYHRNYP